MQNKGTFMQHVVKNRLRASVRPCSVLQISLGVKKGKFSGVIKGRFYVTTSLSDSWEAFTPLHAGVTLGRFLSRIYCNYLYIVDLGHIYDVMYSHVLHVMTNAMYGMAH